MSVKYPVNVDAECKWKTSLAPHFVGTDAVTQLDCYLVKKTSEVQWLHPEALTSILDQCAAVQGAVWNPKYSIFHNTFQQDYLVLFVHQDRVAGFMSATPFRCGETSASFYYSDAMLVPEFRRKGLSRVAYGLLHQAMYQTYQFSALRLFNVVISGNMALFKFFLDPALFRKMHLGDLPSSEAADTLKFIRQDFPDQIIDANNIIRKAWYVQPSAEEPRWPAEVARHFEFPVDVDFVAGDAYFCIFELVRDEVDRISQFLHSRFGETLRTSGVA